MDRAQRERALSVMGRRARVLPARAPSGERARPPTSAPRHDRVGREAPPGRRPGRIQSMKPRLVLACGIALALVPGPLFASPQGNGETRESGSRDDSDRWRFEFVPYVWLASLDGSIGLNPLPTVRV